MDRPDWDTFWLAVANTASLRAECTRRKVGAVAVSGNNVVGFGFNGFLPGSPSCLDGTCPRGALTYEEQPALTGYESCISTHAEENCLRNTRVEDRPGCTVYVSYEPCARCRHIMRAAGVATVVWDGGRLGLQE